MIPLALVRFAAWELALFLASLRLAHLLGWRNPEHPEEKWLAVLAIEVTLESSFAALFSFTGINSPAAYWIAAALCVLVALPVLRDAVSRAASPPILPAPVQTAILAGLTVPLLFLSFKPVEEIDSINYLHYLIDWMANRATPYTFATNYVAFWELSFLPAWTVTHLDFFFPLIALKAVVLLGLAAWLAGKELGLPRNLLLWTVAGSLAMRHYWFLHSGVPTLKNDALHGVGFVLLSLVVLRASRRVLQSTDLALLAFAVAFAAVKYTGIFESVAALAAILFLYPRAVRALPIIAAFFLVTSGHYYLHNLLLYGSPFYPFQINFGPLHLPGTADLSNTSILYNLRDSQLWRFLFLPEGGVSPAGLLFPAILAGTLLLCAWQCVRAGWVLLRHGTQPAPLDWASFLLLCGWLLYFRSVFSASGYAGDLAFLRNNLNSIRYVDGVLALSEILLVVRLARLSWLAWTLVILNLASRLIDLYAQIPANVFPALLVAGCALLTLALFLLLKRHALGPVLAGLLLASPILVNRNRSQWTTYWNELKPALAVVRGKQLEELALPDGGYFAGHIVAAGNPLDPGVRTVLLEDLSTVPRETRPRYLAVLLTPGSEAAKDWQFRYARKLSALGYYPRAESTYGAILERK